MVSKKISIILGITGSYSFVDSNIIKTIRSINDLPTPDYELIIIYDDPAWLTTPLHQMLPLKVSCDYKTMNAGDKRPASLFNMGAANANGEYLLFLWPGCVLSSSGLEKVFRQPGCGNNPSLLVFPSPAILAKYGVDGKYFVDNFFTHFTSSEEIITISQSLIGRNLFEQHGGFAESTLLGDEFQRQFFLKAAKSEKIENLTEPLCLISPSLGTLFPEPISKYLSQSFAVRCGFNGKCDEDDEKNFLSDISENNIKTYAALRQQLQINSPETRPLRIVLISGAWEYHHNKLTFYNYFNLLQGAGKITFVPRLDRIILPEKDLMSTDLVIISRGRVHNNLKVLDYCERFDIPVLYMIDDNWLSIGGDYPSLYGSLFKPGSVDYEIFIESLRRSTAVLVYNRVLEEDVKPFARRVMRIPVNIFADDFSNNRDFTLPEEVDDLLEWRRREKGILLGYVGSARFNDVAFRALAKAGLDRSLNVKIFFFGNLLPEHRRLFKSSPISLPFTTYENYAHIMSILSPDVLVAPLENNRTSNSKCPNKYLEYAVSGSAGIYSDVYPYNEYIKHRVTGILVPIDAKEDVWFNTIMELALDHALRENIIRAARQDVMEHYETRKVLPDFLAMLHQVLEG